MTVHGNPYTLHDMTPPEFAEAVAAEVRAEMGRQRKSQNDLAAALGITPTTAGKRIHAKTPFDTVELAQVATWLNVPVEQFYPRSAATA